MRDGSPSPFTVYALPLGGMLTSTDVEISLPGSGVLLVLLRPLHCVTTSVHFASGRHILLVKNFDVHLEHGSEYCGHLQACSLPTEQLGERCLNATSKPIRVDLTPPMARCGPLYSPRTGPTDVFDVGVACSDNETGIEMAFISLGTESEPGLYLHLVLLDLSNDNSSSTNSTLNSGLMLVNSSAVELLPSSISASGFEGTVRFTARMLPQAIPDGTALAATLTCSNPLGAIATQSSGSLVFDRNRPVASTLNLPSFVWSDLQNAWVGAHDTSASVVNLEVAWTEFEDLGVGIMMYRLCAGWEPFDCSLQSLHTQTHRENLVFDAGRLNMNLTSETVHASATAYDRLGQTAGTSVPVLLDWTVPTIGNLSINGVQRVSNTSNTHMQLEL